MSDDDEKDGSLAEDVCRRCGGTGEVDGDTCPICGGTGKMTESVGGG